MRMFFAHIPYQHRGGEDFIVVAATVFLHSHGEVLVQIVARLQT